MQIAVPEEVYTFAVINYRLPESFARSYLSLVTMHSPYIMTVR